LVEFSGEGVNRAASPARDAIRGQAALEFPPLDGPFALSKVGGHLFPGIQARSLTGILWFSSINRRYGHKSSKRTPTGQLRGNATWRIVTHRGRFGWRVAGRGILARIRRESNANRGAWRELARQGLTWHLRPGKGVLDYHTSRTRTGKIRKIRTLAEKMKLTGPTFKFPGGHEVG